MNTSELKGYLTGLIIGDGHIDKGVVKRGFAIKSVHKDFIDKIHADISSCNTFKLNIRNIKSKIDSKGIHHKECWELRFSSHPYFAKKYHHFYDDYKNRHITKEAINWLTPNGLANWYMSDGYVCLIGKESGYIHHRRIDICTDRYSLENIQMICVELKKKFQLEFNPIKRGKYYRIRLKTESYSRFINLIKPHIVPSMMYKLYLGYQKQPKWMSDSDWGFQNSISAIALTSKVEG